MYCHSQVKAFGSSIVCNSKFAVYVDDLIRKLVESGLGCSVGGVNIGCLFYANDIVSNCKIC